MPTNKNLMYPKKIAAILLSVLVVVSFSLYGANLIHKSTDWTTTVVGFLILAIGSTLTARIAIIFYKHIKTFFSHGFRNKHKSTH